MRYKVFISALAFSLLSTASYARMIDADMTKDIERCLSQGSATTVCEYPEDWRNLNEPLHVARNITWNTPATLQIISKEDIIFEKEAFIKSEGTGSLLLKAGMENDHNRDIEVGLNPRGDVIFRHSTVPQISMKKGKVKVYYNPTPDMARVRFKHKYHNPHPAYYEQHIQASEPKNLVSYMMINDVYDLQDVRLFLSGNYALSQDIDAKETKSWNNKEGFQPIKEERKYLDGLDEGEQLPPHGFSGDFDGNDYTISNLYINRPEEDYVGLFGTIIALENKKSIIQNIKFNNS